MTENKEYSNRCLLPSRPGEKNVEQKNPKGFCCGGKAYDRTAGRECCNGKIFYARKHICCGGNIETNTKDYKCCGGILIKVSTQDRFQPCRYIFFSVPKIWKPGQGLLWRNPAREKCWKEMLQCAW